MPGHCNCAARLRGPCRGCDDCAGSASGFWRSTKTSRLPSHNLIYKQFSANFVKAWVFFLFFSPLLDTDVRLWGFQDVTGVRIWVFANTTDVRKGLGHRRRPKNFGLFFLCKFRISVGNLRILGISESHRCKISDIFNFDVRKFWRK